MLTTRRNKLFSVFCKNSCKWTLHKFDFMQFMELASEKKTNTDQSLLTSFAEKTESRFFARKKGIKESTRFKDACIMRIMQQLYKMNEGS